MRAVLVGLWIGALLLGVHSVRAYELCAYLAGWSEWSAKDIRAAQLTQINYAFALIRDGEVKLANSYDAYNMAELVKVKLRNPKLKINLAVGGWTESAGFHVAAASGDGRRAFCKSLIDLLVKYDLDGVDFDWEYPCTPGQSSDSATYGPEDRENYTELLSETRLYMDNLSKYTHKKYQLSMAYLAGRSTLGYIESDKLAVVLDQVNIMTYDFHGGWDHETAHHTNLDGRDGTPSGMLNVKLAVDNYLNAGFAADKLVVGCAFYGRGWQSVEPYDAGLYQMSSKKGGMQYTYAQLKADFINVHGYKRYWDDAAQAAYLWNGSEFISYDDVQSVRAKAAFVKASALRGIMCWEYTQDSDGELLQAIASQLK